MMVIMLVAACIPFVQGAVIVQNQSSENVSYPSYILFVIVSLSWMGYGLLWTDSTIALSGVVAGIGSIMALVVALSYRPNTSPGAFTVI